MSAKVMYLNDVAKIRNGYAFPSEEFRDVGVPIIRMSDLGEEAVTTKGAARVDSRFFEELPQFRIAKGSLLIGMSGSIGKVAVYASAEPALQNQRVGLFCIKDNRALDSLYLRYFALTLEATLLRRGKGVAVKNVSAEDIEALPIPLPELSEQKRIAALLEKADRLRRTRRYARQLSDTFLQSVFLEMFDNFLIEEGNCVLKDVLARPLSNGSFETNKLYGSGTPVIWVDDLYHTTTINTDHLRRARLSEAAIEKYSVLEGDLLFTRSSLVREGIGQVNVVPKLRERTAFECHIIRARVDQNKVNPFYVLGLYRSPYGRRFIMRRANTATMTTIGQGAIEELPCPVPPLPLQQKFADIARRCERLRAQQREAERQAEHLFQTLLHRAFSSVV